MTQTLDWTEQVRLVNKCIDEGIPLHAELARRGLSYDHLRYEVDHTPKGTDAAVRVVPKPAKAGKAPFVGFFSGCGGMDLGFSAAGYDHVASIEINETFCETLRANHPAWDIIGPPATSGDLSKREHIAKELAGRVSEGFEGIFVGGPPCQPFSVAANQRFSKDGPNFKRVGFAHETNGTLLQDYVWYIRKFRPAAFLIENVPGLETVDGGEQLRVVIKRLKEVGYHITGPTVLESADFGVPQRRKRLFIVGSLRGQFTFPTGTRTHVACATALKAPLIGVKDHVTRNHAAESIARYMVLGYGKRDPLGRVDRLHPGLPSKTVIAGGVKGGGRSHLHPHVPRTLSVRECARLQSFPDWYQFKGPIARQFTQVGNAAPPLLIYELARAIGKQLL